MGLVSALRRFAFLEDGKKGGEDLIGTERAGSRPRIPSKGEVLKAMGVRGP